MGLGWCRFSRDGGEGWAWAIAPEALAAGAERRLPAIKPNLLAKRWMDNWRWLGEDRVAGEYVVAAAEEVRLTLELAWSGNEVEMHWR